MPPNRQLALKRYKSYSRSYDRNFALNPSAERNRRRVVDLLRLQRGDTVLDIGCGTGLNFPLIVESIGEEGRIVGIDLSADMLAVARERVQGARWRNVVLIESPIEDAQIPAEADALLFSFTHDILQSPQALENVFAHAKPGTRVAAVGYKWAPWWTGPWNVAVWWLTRYPITTREGFAKPWRHLERYAPDLEVKTALGGALYFGWGTTGPRERATRPETPRTPS